MIELTLAQDQEKVAPENPFGAEFGPGLPLYHQLRTYQALAEGQVVVNGYNTGTGKTRAALLHLLRRPTINTLFIAPTNELLRQHCEDIRALVERNGLDLDVLLIDAAAVRALADTTSLDRQGARLHALLQDPALALGGRGNRPYILIINPDIFYYAVYCRYGQHDWRNLFKDFVGKFDYLVVDEFHYYNAKQLANFLFFLIVLEGYGFFETGGRACLLTATPNEEVRTYLNRLEARVIYLERGNEPEESQDLPTTPSLAPVELRLIPQSALAPAGLERIIEMERAEIERLIEADEQGAIISGALWRINRIWYTLQHTRVSSRCGRITGPEDRAARTRASRTDLILATPTVDLGYNFTRGAHRGRQNVDFLYFDARHADELVQRLGRAGRVLGKEETERPSVVTAICPDELVAALRNWAGATMSRLEFRQVVQRHLQPRHDLYSYIRSGAIGEAFLPIYRLRGMTERAEQDRVEALFESVRAVFAPNSRRRFCQLQREICGFLRREHLFHDWPATMEAQVKRAFDGFLEAHSHAYDARERALLRAGAARRGNKLHKRVMTWIDCERSAYEVKRALYNFRESFEPPPVLVYDPKNLLSSQPVRAYDLFHIIATYEVLWHQTEREWREETGQVAPAVEVVAYCELRALRPAEQRLRLRYNYDAGETREEWQERFREGPSALRGIQVTADGALLPSAVIDALGDRYLVCYARDPNAKGGGSFLHLGRHGDVRVVPMDVDLAGEGTREYVAVLGSEAFLAWAELGWLEQVEARERARNDAPIVI